MEFSVDQQYRLNRLLLSVYGLWPYQSRTTNTCIKRVFAILFMIWTTFVQVIKICQTELTADFIFDCLPIIIPNIGAIVQFLNRIIINNKLKDLFEQIKIDWENARSQNEIEIMQVNAVDVRIMTKFFLIYSFLGITVYMLTTFIPQILDVFLPLNESRSREHPFHAEFFIDQEKYFYTTRFIMYFSTVFIAEMIIANGSIFIVYMQHANGMFTILGHRAERSFSDNKQLLKSQFNHRKKYGSVALFVKDHRNILRFVNIVQSCYGLSLSLELLSSIIVMGFTMLQIIKFSESSDRSARSCAYIIGQIIYIFIYSYMGQQLINKSTQLCMEIYYTEWYSISVWKQKMMLLVMLKCMRTISINAYIYILSLENFSTIMQSALSICMLLRRM